MLCCRRASYSGYLEQKDLVLQKDFLIELRSYLFRTASVLSVLGLVISTPKFGVALFNFKDVSLFYHLWFLLLNAV